MAWLICALLLALPALEAAADVYFEEEVVNPGFGKKKRGARRTIHKVYIKGKKQKVEAQIIADKKTARALKKQGQPLLTSTILNLDAAEVYEIDLEAQTVRRAPVPPPRAARKAAASRGGPEIRFAYKVPGDSAVVAGIPCKRVVAQMRARYYGKKKFRRENRYTYDACMADHFPVLREIEAFQALQDSSTSYPSLFGGGLEQFRQRAEDLDALREKLAGMERELRGFALESTLTAAVLRAGKKKPVEVFRLERRVRTLRHTRLPDSLFAVSKALTPIEK